MSTTTKSKKAPRKQSIRKVLPNNVWHDKNKLRKDLQRCSTAAATIAADLKEIVNSLPEGVDSDTAPLLCHETLPETEMRVQIEAELRPKIEAELRPQIEAEMFPRLKAFMRSSLTHELYPKIREEVTRELESKQRSLLRRPRVSSIDEMSTMSDTTPLMTAKDWDVITSQADQEGFPLVEETLVDSQQTCLSPDVKHTGDTTESEEDDSMSPSLFEPSENLYPKFPARL